MSRSSDSGLVAMLLLRFFGLSLLCSAAVAQFGCNDGNPIYPCGNSAMATGFACRNAAVRLPDGGRRLNCCPVNNPPENAPTCGISNSQLSRVSGTQRFIRNSQSSINSNAKKAGIPNRPPGGRPPQDQTVRAAGSVGNTDQLGRNSVSQQSVLQGSRSFVGGPLNLLLNSRIYPDCPVHVKMCYRVQCGSVNNDNNPLQCLLNSQCCYDYGLAFMRSFFGPLFFPGVPLCYYGPTSRQWAYVTSFFKPWNPWYTEFVLRIFDGIFNTNAFSLGGRFACEFNAGRKAYPVGYKSELECNLVSGCWDDDLPPGLQCFMPADFLLQLFGQSLIFPSLFTDDVAETQCSSNWFDFGPKAYTRLPCNIRPRPDGIFDTLYGRWCNAQECCLNYAAFRGRDAQLLQLFLGGGNNFNLFNNNLNPLTNLLNPLNNIFNPLNPQVAQTPNNPAIFAYLLRSDSDDLTELFCPFRSVFSSSLFPDFDDDVEGCCDIPICYHKKKLRGIGTPSPAQWGQWGPCSAVQCGTFGTRTRQCLSGGQPRPGFCTGPSSESCQAPPCQQAQWGQWGPCSAVQCGTFGTRSRQCILGGQTRPGFCTGPSTQSCQAPPCQQAQWGQWGPCSAIQCGTFGTRTRQCLFGGQPRPGFCAGQSTQSCQAPACQQAQWGQWGPCSAIQCGTFGTRTRQCLFGGQPRPGFCAGQSTQSCQAPPCQQAQWGQWGPCSAFQCGTFGTRTRQCLFGGQPRPGFCAGQSTQSCQAPPCQQAQWGQWGPCSAVRCGTFGGTRSRQCLLGGQPRPGFCVGPSTEPCQAPPCQQAQWGQWGPCNAIQCGTFGTRIRQCLLGGQIRPRFCAGSNSQTCQAPPCQQDSAQWGNWSPPSTCSVPCGGGQSTITRKCFRGSVEVGASNCPGGLQAATYILSCNPNPCFLG